MGKDRSRQKKKIGSKVQTQLFKGGKEREKEKKGFLNLGAKKARARTGRCFSTIWADQKEKVWVSQKRGRCGTKVGKKKKKGSEQKKNKHKSKPNEVFQGNARK